MKRPTITPHILDAIREEAKSDKEIKDFIINLLYEEAQRYGQWQFKAYYRATIERHCQQWGNKHED